MKQEYYFNRQGVTNDPANVDPVFHPGCAFEKRRIAFTHVTSDSYERVSFAAIYTQRTVASEISGYLKLKDGQSWQQAADSIQGFASVVGKIAKITLTDNGIPGQQLKFVVGYDDQQSATEMFKLVNTIHEHAGTNVYGNVAMWDHTMEIPSLSAQIN